MTLDVATPDEEARRRTSVGVFYALAAFGFWGINPLYFKAVDHIPALEVMAHRVVWSVLLLALLVSLSRRWRVVAKALADRRTVVMLLLSTAIISVNWLVYIWAINVERVLETSLGYYINPLVSVLLGVLVLGERLTLWQGLAVLLAACGVANLAWGIDQVPWVALLLAFTFGVYGLIRKTVRIESVDGLLVETGMMLPLALVYLIYLAALDQGSFGTLDRSQDLLLDCRLLPVHRAELPLPARRLRVRRALHDDAPDHLPADLDGAGDLHAAVAGRQSPAGPRGGCRLTGPV